MLLQSVCKISACSKFYFHRNCAIITRRNILTRENIAVAQVSGTHYSQCLWSERLMVCLPPSLQSTSSYCPFCFIFCLFTFILLFWLPSYLFTGSCPVLFKVIYHSCQTNVLCPTFHSFHHCHCPCHPHMWQPLCIYSFISSLRIHSYHTTARIGRLWKANWKYPVSMVWHTKWLRLVNKPHRKGSLMSE